MKVGFVVEGFNDETLVKQLFPDSVVVVAKGTRVNNRVKQEIQSALDVCDQVFLLTDPDPAGDWLANKVQETFPHLTRIPIAPQKASCYRHHKWKIGVEHCDPSYLLSQISLYLNMGVTT
ncbi:toprim domain-containing protein [Cytobacillus sp. FJAT-54145]|uniref:Toprim domain-containing protein n=1 Tax=Cytobacillus spartinae TaxID=3299023 RepID=A0ABW6KA04_9BACI